MEETALKFLLGLAIGFAIILIPPLPLILRDRRRRRTRWHICLIQVDDGWSHVVVRRQELRWETSMPAEQAMTHLPMIGSKWGDCTVEAVYSNKGR